MELQIHQATPELILYFHQLLLLVEDTGQGFPTLPPALVDLAAEVLITVARLVLVILHQQVHHKEIMAALAVLQILLVEVVEEQAQ